MGHLQPEQRLLVARARLGDEQAFQSLVHHYTRRLLWFVRKLGLPEVTADDVVQESWLVAWASLHRLRKVESFRSWLYGIVRNKALQHLAKEREVPTGDLDVAAETPEESVFDHYMPHLNRALEQLSVIHREVLALRFLEGMTYEELSEATDATAGTIKSRLHNAKLALRRQLEAIADD